jgi:hypothetical protein
MKVMIRSIFANETSRERGEIKADLEDREVTLNQMQEKGIKILESMSRSSPQNLDEVKLRYELIINSIDFLSTEIVNLRSKLSDTMAFSAKAKWSEKG